MSKYTCYNEWSYGVTYGSSKDLEPKDFLNCEDEDELEDLISDVLSNEPTEKIDSFDIGGRYHDGVHIPEEFLTEWRKLKGYE